MKKQNTRRALIFSVLSLLLCVSMLIGTTYAWFTDSVTSGNNIIKSGTLDVVLEYKTKTTDTWLPVTADTKLFKEDALYEPGYTEVVFLRVSNAGNLALKYNLKVNVLDETTSTNVDDEIFSLKDYLEIGSYQMDESLGQYLLPVFFNTREKALSNVTTQKLSAFDGIVAENAPLEVGAESASLVTLVLTMPETVGNEANHKSNVEAPSIDLGVTLLATQYIAEEDDFDRYYDKDATYPVVVSTVKELADAIADGGRIKLANDVVVNQKISLPAGKEVELDLGGKTLAGAFDNPGGSALIENLGTMTVTNGKIVSLAEHPDTDWGTEGFPTYATNTISNRGTLVISKDALIENETNVGGASYAVDNYSGATLTVNGGNIKAKDVAIRMFSNSATNENKVVINGGNIVGKRAIWIQLPSNNSAVAPKTTLEINGGNLDSTSDLTIYSYSYGNSFAATNVTFNGGTFAKDVAFGGGYKGDKEKVKVNGGTFNGKLGRYLVGDIWENIAKP